MTLNVYADLCRLLAATIQNSVVIGYKMQLTGCHNGNEKRNATCAASKTSKVPTQDALLFISYSMAMLLLSVHFFCTFASCNVSMVTYRANTLHNLAGN